MTFKILISYNSEHVQDTVKHNFKSLYRPEMGFCELAFYETKSAVTMYTHTFHRSKHWSK
jgi:hypothetical protein